MAFELYLVIYCLACVVIQQGYENTLTSHLTIVKEPKPIETLTQLAVETSGDIVHINLELNDFFNILKTSPLERLRTLTEHRNVVARRTSYPDLYKEALQGHTVIASKVLAQYEIRRQLSYSDRTTDMRIVPQPFTSYPLGYHMPRMNRFNGLINKRLHQLIESGLIAQIYKRVVNKVKSVPLARKVDNLESHTLEASPEPLNLTAYLLLFIAYIIGNIIAIFSFFCENHICGKKSNDTHSKMPQKVILSRFTNKILPHSKLPPVPRMPKETKFPKLRPSSNGIKTNLPQNISPAKPEPQHEKHDLIQAVDMG